jgi:hypothetical protein
MRNDELTDNLSTRADELISAKASLEQLRSVVDDLQVKLGIEKLNAATPKIRPEIATQTQYFPLKDGIPPLPIERPEPVLTDRHRRDQPKPPVSLVVGRPKSTRTGATSAIRTQLSNIGADEGRLALGGTVPGQRSIHGVKTPIKPTKTPTATARPLMHVAEGDTLRITQVQYPEPPSPVPDLPIVIPVSVSTFQCDPMAVTSGGPRRSDGINPEEFAKLTQRLQERVNEFQKAIASKERALADFQRKLADAARDRLKADIEYVKLQDRLRRTQIRFGNIQTRLDIAMSELGAKEDDNFRMRQQMLRLRSILAATKATRSALEQERLKHEKKGHKMVAEAAARAIGKTDNKEIQAHLERLIANTQKSLARIEGKRRMWKEAERQQVYGALSAISLISEEPSDFVLTANSVDKTQFRRMQEAWGSGP